MQVSGRAGQSFLEKPDQSAWAVLIHCSDDGVAADGERSLLDAWQSQNPIERVRLSEDEVGRDASLLFDKLEAQSLLGDETVLQLHLSNEKLAPILVEAIGLEEASPGRFAARLVVTAGSLKKTSKLRKTFETSARAWSVHLFEDDVSDIRTVISDALSDHELGIDPGAIDLFATRLPGHRRLAHREIEKIALYAHGLGRAISVNDVLALSTSDIDHALHGFVQASFLGDPAAAVLELSKLEAAGQSPISLLRGLQRQASQVLDAHARDVRDSRAAGRLRPPVWSNQWPSFKTIMQNWSAKQLVRLVSRIEGAEAQAKSASHTAAPAVRQLMNDMLRYADRR